MLNYVCCLIRNKIDSYEVLSLSSPDFQIMVMHYDVPAEISDEGCCLFIKVSKFTELGFSI